MGRADEMAFKAMLIEQETGGQLQAWPNHTADLFPNNAKDWKRENRFHWNNDCVEPNEDPVNRAHRMKLNWKAVIFRLLRIGKSPAFASKEERDLWWVNAPWASVETA